MFRVRTVVSSKVLKTKREAKTCQESDYLIVAKKPVKAEGAKGVTNQHLPEVKHE